MRPWLYNFWNNILVSSKYRNRVETWHHILSIDLPLYIVVNNNWDTLQKIYSKLLVLVYYVYRDHYCTICENTSFVLCPFNRACFVLLSVCTIVLETALLQKDSKNYGVLKKKFFVRTAPWVIWRDLVWVHNQRTFCYNQDKKAYDISINIIWMIEVACKFN